MPAAPVTGLRAVGYLGQYLVVYPKKRLVAVRQLRSPEGKDDKVDEFPDCLNMVDALVK